MDLTPDEQIPPRMHEIAQHLVELGWYTELTPARHAWPYAILWADHASGARIFIRAGWANRCSHNGLRRFPGKKYGYWFSPPPDDRIRSAWYSLKRAAPTMHMAEDPYQDIPASAWQYGFIPRQQMGCDCGKLKHRGEQAAAEALARAQAAREAGMEWRQECRYYQCPQDALAFHLTSLQSWSLPMQRST